MKKVLFYFIFIILFFNLVFAQPPFQTLDDKLVLETNIIEYHPINTEFYLHTHVYYTDTGLIVNTSNLVCNYHLYDSNINWEHKDIGVLTEYGAGMFATINETNFTQTGMYSILFWCEETTLNIGGFTQFTFETVEENFSEKNFDNLILAQIFIILFFIGAGLLFKAKMYTRILAFGLAIIQFLILVFINLGIYIGTDLTTLLRANSYIFLIIGFGVGVLSLLQHMKAIYLEEEQEKIKKKWQ